MQNFNTFSVMYRIKNNIFIQSVWLFNFYPFQCSTYHFRCDKVRLTYHNGVFQMLSHDMKQLELQRLKKLAMERPPKIRRYSFLLLGCMLLLYMGVMGYQILGTMSGIF